MSNIPEAREILNRVRDELIKQRDYANADRVRVALSKMTREKPIRPKAREKMKRLTLSDKARIKAFALANPDTHISEIAEMFGTNQGRVSEALHGH